MSETIIPQTQNSRLSILKSSSSSHKLNDCSNNNNESENEHQSNNNEPVFSNRTNSILTRNLRLNSNTTLNTSHNHQKFSLINHTTNSLSLLSSSFSSSQITNKIGFADLSFIDFSCINFPRIAQNYCELWPRKIAFNSPLHNYTCKYCSYSFPCPASLILHMSKNNLNCKCLIDLNNSSNNKNDNTAISTVSASTSAAAANATTNNNVTKCILKTLDDLITQIEYEFEFVDNNNLNHRKDENEKMKFLKNFNLIQKSDLNEYKINEKKKYYLRSKLIDVNSQFIRDLNKWKLLHMSNNQNMHIVQTHLLQQSSSLFANQINANSNILSNSNSISNGSINSSTVNGVGLGLQNSISNGLNNATNKILLKPNVNSLLIRIKKVKRIRPITSSSIFYYNTKATKEFSGSNAPNTLESIKSLIKEEALNDENNSNNSKSAKRNNKNNNNSGGNGGLVRIVRIARSNSTSSNSTSTTPVQTSTRNNEEYDEEDEIDEDDEQEEDIDNNNNEAFDENDENDEEDDKANNLKKRKLSASNQSLNLNSNTTTSSNNSKKLKKSQSNIGVPVKASTNVDSISFKKILTITSNYNKSLITKTVDNNRINMISSNVTNAGIKEPPPLYKAPVKNDHQYHQSKQQQKQQQQHSKLLSNNNNASNILYNNDSSTTIEMPKLQPINVIQQRMPPKLKPIIQLIANKDKSSSTIETSTSKQQMPTLLNNTILTTNRNNQNNNEKQKRKSFPLSINKQQTSKSNSNNNSNANNINTNTANKSSNDTNKILKCKFCSDIFKGESKFFHHVLVAHPEIVKERLNRSNKTSNTANTSINSVTTTTTSPTTANNINIKMRIS